MDTKFSKDIESSDKLEVAIRKLTNLCTLGLEGEVEEVEDKPHTLLIKGNKEGKKTNRSK